MVDPIKIEDVLAHVEFLLQSQEIDAAAEYLLSLHPADSAEVLAGSEPDVQAALVSRMSPPDLADMLEQMDDEEAADVAQHLSVDQLGEVLDEMEPDMAADLIGELEPESATAVLEQMDEAETVMPLLRYPEDSAGGIMTVAPPSLRADMSVAKAFSFVKEIYRDASEVFYLYVLDDAGRLVGVVNFRTLLLADQDQMISDIMQEDVITVGVDLDQEEVAQFLARYDLLALPVVDADNRLAGIVTIDDVVDVLEEEATEDIYRLAQVGEGSAIFSPISRAVRNRLPWLYVNLGTAIAASFVVAFFENTIASIAVLAAFMPIVAGLGGNGGNQSMTIVVRSLALGELHSGNTWRALGHELALGLFHGLVLGLSMGVIAWIWQGNAMLGVVIGIAMLANLIIAALAGVLVPTTLKRIGVDPALASSIFVTTATDIMGFGIFLGLATYFIRLLL